jgi:hypothetical protein
MSWILQFVTVRSSSNPATIVKGPTALFDFMQMTGGQKTKIAQPQSTHVVKTSLVVLHCSLQQKLHRRGIMIGDGVYTSTILLMIITILIVARFQSRD